MNKVYVLIEENSPELAIDCGAYNIISVFKDWTEAKKAAIKQTEVHCSNGYEIVDRIDGGPYGSPIAYSLYERGYEDSDIWIDVIVESVPIVGV